MNRKKALLLCLLGVLLGVCVYSHRGVILALIKGEELPETPESCPWKKSRGD